MPSCTVVVGCVSSKSSPPVAALGDLPYARDWFRLARRWRETLAKGTDRQPLATLYRGPQWRAAKAVVEVAGPNAHGHVVSAGLGLRPLEWLAPSYEATFSGGPNSPLAVARKRGWQTEDATSEWWRALTAGGGWGRLLDVALGAKPEDPTQAEHPLPGGHLLAVLSTPYWRAVGESLALALRARPTVADRVWLLCVAPVRLPKPAADRLLPTQGVDWAGFFGRQ